MDPLDLYPSPSKEALKNLFVGKQLGEVATPAAVLDRAVIERNCSQMLRACQALDLLFRAHVKTTKTTEVTQLQVGKGSSTVSIVVSTLVEAEHLLGYLQECRKDGKAVNVLYGIPLPPSQMERLSQLGKKLGPGSISVMIDHPGQLSSLRTFKNIAGFGVSIYVKVDTGYHRAGLSVDSTMLKNLLQDIFQKVEPVGIGELCGFYSHAGHSYGGDSQMAAMELLEHEIKGLEHAGELANDIAKQFGDVRGERKYILSVGATPTATSVENLLDDSYGTRPWKTQEQMSRLKTSITNAKVKYAVEIHAGVYPILDMQQLATKASPSAIGMQDATFSDVALSILAEVASVYPHRTVPEALIAAGSLALGREPCKSYDGWGVVSAWNSSSGTHAERSAWEVGRISQEHGILKRSSPSSGHDDLQMGQKVRIWPNHACVAGAGFGWYLVVDSSLPPCRHNEIIDVWVRWRGW